MRPNKKFVWVAIFIAVSAVVAYLMHGLGERQEIFPVARTVRYGFTVENPTPQVLKNAGFWVYAPLPLTSAQRRLSVEASHPYDSVVDGFGNERMVFSFSGLPPHAIKVISIEAKLAMALEPNPIELVSRSFFTRAEAFIESESDQIVALANELRSENSRLSIEKTFDWIRQNVRFSGFSKADRSALFALREREGDCTEYAYLTAALGRAQDFPVRVMAGFVIDKDTVLSPAFYHNWAEFYVDDAWELVDAQKGAFMSKSSNYISMRVVESGKGEAGSQELFEGFGGVVVRMNDLPVR